jgi:Cu-Zn family superoxide dismutase
MTAMKLGLGVVAALLLAACSREQPEGSPRQPDDATAAPAEKTTTTEAAPEAVAQIAPTQGNTVTGSLALTPAAEGVRISGAIQGLKPDAEFGFHIHEKGDCSAPDGSSAGAHFNPAQAQHGNPASGAHHAGDMVNIRSNGEGVAQVDTTVAGTALHGDPNADVMGKAIVVHESPDDYTTQPSGNSGKRVACGVISAPTPSPQ